MKESFDPLAEAERRSDPQLVRYNETIGHDPSANADYAAYLRTRDFEDTNGNVHDAKTSKFKARNGESDTYETDLINSAHAEALEENALRDSSLDALAKKVAKARSSGDTEAAAHAEDLFFDKFTKLSEKYGWEEDDDSANDTLRVDKDAKVGRTTIDNRLARYSKIMYGEEADTAAKSSETVAESEKPAVAEKDVDGTDRVEKESTSESEAKTETTPAAEEKKFDVDAEVEQAKERLNQLAEEREQQANEARDSSEAAKADRELIPRVSTDGLKDLDDKPRIPRVSTEGIEDEEAVEPARPEKGFLNRARRALYKGKELYLRAAYEFGHTLDLAKDELTKRGGRKPGETEEQYERRMRRNGQGVALGIVALAGASIAAKFGAFDGLFDGNAHAGGNRSGSGRELEDAADQADRGNRGASEGRETIADHLSAEQLGDFRIPSGSGGEALMDRLGADKSVWYENQNEFLRKFPNEAYRMADGNVGFADNGRLSNGAIKFWSQKSGIWH